MDMILLFNLLGIPIEEWTIYIQLIRYQAQSSMHICWIDYVIAYLWLGTYVAWIHRFFFGVHERGPVDYTRMQCMTEGR